MSYSHKRRMHHPGGNAIDSSSINDLFDNKFVDLTVGGRSSLLSRSGHDDSDFVDSDSDDVVFIREEPVIKYKKQRTVSLPQLPFARLVYSNENSVGIRAVQNDEELLHLTGDSNITIDSNRQVDLNVVRSLSPYSRMADTSVFGTVSDLPPFKTDKDGHYIYQENNVFCDGRFLVKELLGQGTFGKVLKCQDLFDSNRLVAIKIIKAIDRYREAAKTELRILKTIKKNDPFNNYQCILLKDCFDYKNHICLITDLYGKSVYDFMCSNATARFPGSQVQSIARQLIRSVCFLHDLGIIHTDLKPENILLVDDQNYVSKKLPASKIATLSVRRKNASNGGIHKILKNPEIKIIDFGSAIFYNEYHPPVISTRHYRAPEIILGLGWSYPCDIWSIACVLVELVTGESLYPIHENLEHMAMMQRISGEILPKKIVEKMFYKYNNKIGNLPSDLNATVLKHFDKKTLTLQWPEVNKRGEIISPQKSIKRVRDTCNRLDILLSKKLSQDFHPDTALTINWNLTAEQNWGLIKPSMRNFTSSNSSNSSATPNYSYYNQNTLPSYSQTTTDSQNKYQLDKETFMFWYHFVDLLRKMFEFDPTKRITAREALEHEWFNLGILDEGISSYESYQG